MSRLERIVEACRYPGGAAAITSARPRSLTSWLIVNRLKRLGLDFQTVIDGGANVGQFARAVAQCYPHAQIFSFEPLTEVADQLSANLSDVPKLRVFRTALGAADGEVTFYRNEYSQSSSTKKIVDSGDSLLTDKKHVAELKVPIARLDTALAQVTLPEKSLLKLDLQGNELEALEGAPQTLKQCSHVLIETVFQQQYENEAVFDELWSFLKSQGYTFHRLLNVTTSATGGIVQADALFRNER